MGCNITCFERTIHKIKPLPKNKIREACELIAEGYLQHILDFGIYYGCFSQLESYTLHDGILVWDGLDIGSNCTADTEKLWELYTHMGITKELFNMYKSDNSENSTAFVLLDIESVLPEKYEIVSTDFSSTWIKDTDTNKIFKISVSEEHADT